MDTLPRTHIGEKRTYKRTHAHMREHVRVVNIFLGARECVLVQHYDQTTCMDLRSFGQLSQTSCVPVRVRVRVIGREFRKLRARQMKFGSIASIEHADALDATIANASECSARHV